jgi:hypothetical protein
MSAIASKSLDTRNSLLRSVVLGGLIIFILQFTHIWIVATLIQGSPFTAVWQYIASGALGMSAFEGGIPTALLGVLFHLIISFVVAGVFILSADRIPLLRRYPIPAALLYGLGVYFVMNMVVTPLSAAPPLPPPTTPWLVEGMLEHVLAVGLPLGLIVRRSLR